MVVGLSIRLFTQTTHPCDVTQPLSFTATTGIVTVAACWSGLDTSTPPLVVTNPVWMLVVDNTPQPLPMVKSGVASASGQYLYSAQAVLSVGSHQAAVQVAQPTGEAAQSFPPITIVVPMTPNLPPVVDAGPNINVPFGSPGSFVGKITDDGFPQQVSSDGLRIPNATQIITTTFDVWTLAAGTTLNRPILKNGVQAGGGEGSRLLWYGGVIYAQGDDQVPTWYQWNATTWVQVGADPGPTTVPAIPNPLTQVWSQTSGPGVTTFTSPTSLQTQATFSAAGTYIERLTGSDGQLQAFDEVTVVVQPPIPPPVLVAATKTSTCTLTLSATVPDAQAGWKFQGLYGTTNPTSQLGSVDSTPPYSAQGTVLPGVYKVAGKWTRTGSVTIILSTQIVSCQ